MMQFGGQFLRFVLLFYSRAVLIVAVLAGLAAAWGYYGYQRIGCHPMFTSANVECGSLQTLSAEHAMAMARAVVPYQQMLRDNQQLLIQALIGALIIAVLIELMFAVVKILQRRRLRRLSNTLSEDLARGSE